MDPLTALGIASNIIQFIEFTARFISNATEIYHSSSGTTGELQDVSLSTNDLQSLIIRLGTPALPKSAPADDETLAALANNCRKTCAELQDLVQQVKSKVPSSKIESLRATCRALGKKAKLEAIEKKLEGYRSQILSHVLIMLKYVLIRISHSFMIVHLTDP